MPRINCDLCPTTKISYGKRHVIQKQRLKIMFRSGVALLILVGWSATARSQWTALTNAPPAFLDTAFCSLMERSCVISMEQQLAPAETRSVRQLPKWIVGRAGIYVANMPNGNDPSFGCMNCSYTPTYFASVCTAATAEWSSSAANTIASFCPSPPNYAVWTNIGFLYHPVTNSWSSQLTEPFGGGCVGDSSSTILANGTMLLADGVDCTTFATSRHSIPQR